MISVTGSDVVTPIFRVLCPLYLQLELIVRNLASALILLAVSAPALALPTTRVDEPSAFALMALAAVASVVIARRRK